MIANASTLDILRKNKGSFSEEFLEWLPKNLHIFSEFCIRAKALKRAGRKYYGAKGIVEVIRYDTMLREKPDVEFKINNSYTAGMSRLCMLTHKELDGFFKTRER